MSATETLTELWDMIERGEQFAKDLPAALEAAKAKHTPGRKITKKELTSQIRNVRELLDHVRHAEEWEMYDCVFPDESFYETERGKTTLENLRVLGENRELLEQQLDILVSAQSRRLIPQPATPRG